MSAGRQELEVILRMAEEVMLGSEGRTGLRGSREAVVVNVGPEPTG
jgi:hypothetical protein